MLPYCSFIASILFLGISLHHPPPKSLKTNTTLVSQNLQDTLFAQGQALYKTNCVACHPSSPKGGAGPAPNLVGVQMRWKDYPKEDLFNFIRNSQRMIKEGHPKAVKVSKQWDGVMTAYPSLSDEEIQSMLYFVDKEAYQKE